MLACRWNDAMDVIEIDDVSQLMDALKLTDVLFCGVSIGGMIGQVLAAKRTDVVCAAVLCNTASKIGTAERWEERIAAIKESGVAGCAEMIVNNWFGPTYAAQADKLALHKTMVSRTSDAGYIAACGAIRDADLAMFAQTIEVPTLCIGGQHDQSVSPEAVQALAQTIPGAQIDVFDGLGHLPCLEIPVSVLDHGGGLGHCLGQSGSLGAGSHHADGGFTRSHGEL